MNLLITEIAVFLIDDGNGSPLLPVLHELVMVRRSSGLIVGYSSLLQFLMLVVACSGVTLICWCREFYCLGVIGFNGVFWFWLTDLNEK